MRKFSALNITLICQTEQQFMLGGGQNNVPAWPPGSQAAAQS